MFSFFFLKICLYIIIFINVKLKTEIVKWHQALFTNPFKENVGKHPVICHNNMSPPVDNSFSHRRVAVYQTGPGRRGVWREIRYQVSSSAASSQSYIFMPAHETLIFYLQNKIWGAGARRCVGTMQQPKGCHRRTFYAGGQYRKWIEFTALA